MKTKIFGLLIALLVSMLSYSQHNHEREFEWFDIPFRTNNSSIIAEGTVTDYSCYENTVDGRIYTKYKVQFHKLFKGNPSKNTIDLILVGGETANRSTVVPHIPKLICGQTYVLFMKPLDQTGSRTHLSEGIIELDLKEMKGYDDFDVYDVEEDIYLKIELETRRKRNLISLNPIERERGYSLANGKLEFSKKSNFGFTGTSTPSSVSLYLGLDNPTFFFDSVSMSYKYQFEVSATSSDSTRITELAFGVRTQNYSAFGNAGIVADGRVDIQTDMSNSNYALNFVDYFPSFPNFHVFEVNISHPTPADSINNLIVLSPIERKVVATVTMELINGFCVDSVAVILYTELASNTGNPSDMSINYFLDDDNVTIKEYVSIEGDAMDYTLLCSTHGYVDISPTEVSAGVGDSIVIRGSEFGINPGWVFFRQVDTKNEKWTTGYIDSPSDMLWSDTLIVVKVPSFTRDSTPVPSIIPQSRYNGNTPGTGKVRVVTQSGSIYESNQDVYIKWSERNARYFASGINQEKPIRLTKSNSSGGYLIQVQSDFLDTFPDASIVVSDAIENWQCRNNTQINWKLDSLLYGGTILRANDNLNVIGFGDDTLYTSAVTNALIFIEEGRSVVCSDNRFLNEFDIIFRKESSLGGLKWYVDNDLNSVLDKTQLDFYTILLHELGHAHGLSHTANIDQVMYWLQRESEVKRVLTSEDVDGGNYPMQGANLISCDTIEAMIPIICPPTSTTDLLNQISGLFVFPQPSSGRFNALVNTNIADNATIKIHTLNGHLVYSEDTNLIKGENYLTIDLVDNNVFTGVFLFSVQTSNQILTKKITLLP